MDYAAYAYDPNLLGTFRGLVDDAYERVGQYQDIDVTQTILQAPVSGEITSVRPARDTSRVSESKTCSPNRSLIGHLCATARSRETTHANSRSNRRFRFPDETLIENRFVRRAGRAYTEDDPSRRTS